MNLLDILTRDCVKAPLDAGDKKGVIEELVDLLAGAGKVDDAQALKDAVWTREQARTTGIGHGLAIPHGKSDSCDRLVMAVGKPSEPIDFNAIDGQPVSVILLLAMAIGKPTEPIDFAAIDGKPVRLVVLLASPPDKTSDHIQALARISRLMTMENFRDQIYEAESAEQIFDLLQSQELASQSS